MKLWHGWHNTYQDTPYFHYGPLREGGGLEQMRTLAQKHVKEKKHEVRNKKSQVGVFI